MKCVRMGLAHALGERARQVLRLGDDDQFTCFAELANTRKIVVVDANALAQGLYLGF